jgi:hypothetical protein
MLAKSFWPTGHYSKNTADIGKGCFNLVLINSINACPYFKRRQHTTA